ncbi:DeoR/GlpR family DNA-binding transcription regulator [Cohnella rhizosphaerae]|uniref:DeoR/GlpR family DNA-binding transcription regulator n=1 Tax=Cohnella rhizosphaerae TaxID=1457232 RepID=A0A9X4L0L2_9BACL|nr:DeoR/GlpR family DNA-binding transcription regulator [Cohnella rhizosphaerae]MDG0811269.1 DeoR/GlpR family DNA-binding transcription regulator [Cohnella rhizosphaerae]
MLPLQRKQLLIDYLAEKGVATMRELSERFGVSEMTVRRDLNALEQENVIRRSHGGAVYLGTRAGPGQDAQGQDSQGQDEPALTDKQAHNRDVKESLAAYAAQRFVTDGDIVAMENGTTVSYMVDRLGQLNELTLLTNGLDTLNRFRPYAGDRRSAIACGGHSPGKVGHVRRSPGRRVFLAVSSRYAVPVRARLYAGDRLHRSEPDGHAGQDRDDPRGAPRGRAARFLQDRQAFFRPGRGLEGYRRLRDRRGHLPGGPRAHREQRRGAPYRVACYSGDLTISNKLSHAEYVHL